MPWSPKVKTARVPLMGVSSGSIHRASRAKIAFMMIEYTRRSAVANYGVSRAEIGCMLYTYELNVVQEFPPLIQRSSSPSTQVTVLKMCRAPSTASAQPYRSPPDRARVRATFALDARCCLERGEA